jgi:hypothetical protein
MKKDMEPYNIEEFTEKIKKSIKILLYLWQIKGDRTYRPSLSNIIPSVGESGATIYFELIFPVVVADPDIDSFIGELKKIDKLVNDFFGNIVLLPNAEFKYYPSKIKDSDDMIGLVMSANYDWKNDFDDKNGTVTYGFEYNLYYNEYSQYFGS